MQQSPTVDARLAEDVVNKSGKALGALCDITKGRFGELRDFYFHCFLRWSEEKKMKMDFSHVH